MVSPLWSQNNCHFGTTAVSVIRGLYLKPIAAKVISSKTSIASLGMWTLSVIAGCHYSQRVALTRPTILLYLRTAQCMDTFLLLIY